MMIRIPTANMTDADWHKTRRESIGGSDAAALLGLTPYKSAYSLWAEKTGKIIPEDISAKEAVRLGHDLEDYVASRFAEATGKRVRRENHFLKNDAYPFAHALPDRMVIGENAGLECKTTSNYDTIKMCKSGKYPDYWYCQIVHYMMVTGAAKWYLAVICFGDGFYKFEIPRNEDEIVALSAAEAQFWEYVKNDLPPPVDGSESTQNALRTIYQDSNEHNVDLSAVEKTVSRYLDLQAKKKEIDEQINIATAEIQSFMGDAECGICNVAKISWKTQQRRTFNRKAYEMERGAIPDIYFTQVTSRPFKVASI